MLRYFTFTSNTRTTDTAVEDFQIIFHSKKTCTALHGITEIRSVTCHMGSHSVTCHPTQVNVLRLNPSHAGRYSIYLPRRDGRLSWPCYSVAQPPGVELATSRSRIQRPNHWATEQLGTGYIYTKCSVNCGKSVDLFSWCNVWSCSSFEWCSDSTWVIISFTTAMNALNCFNTHTQTHNITSAVPIVFFSFRSESNSWAIIWNFESNRIVIIGLKSHQ